MKNRLLILAALIPILGIAQFSFQENIIEQHSIAAGAWSICASDFDNDGDKDVFTGYIDSSFFILYENVNGEFEEKKRINTHSAVMSIVTADLDNDGDMDVVTGDFFGEIIWYENTDGKGSFQLHNIGNAGGNLASVTQADIDGDGDIDVISSSEFGQKIIPFINTDGKGSFSEGDYIFDEIGSPRFILSGDVDNDGDMDLIAALFGNDEIVWFKNDGQGNYSDKLIIGFVPKPAHLDLVDIDGDGHKDILSGSFNGNKTAYWFKNADGQGNFDDGNVITADAGKIAKILGADIDKDGDMDVVIASESKNSIIWFENENGNFSSEKIIYDKAYEVQAIEIVDIDNDAHIDIISASYNPSKVAWHKNNSNENFTTNVIYSVAGYAYSCLTDIDNDNDLDVIFSSYYNGELLMYENTDGDFLSKEVLTTFGQPAFITSADINEDSSDDIIVFDARNISLFWYDHKTHSKNEITIPKDPITTIYPTDINNDGHVDLVTHSYSSGLIRWFEHDGISNFKAGQLINNELANNVFTADIDNDGDIDIITGGTSYENQLNYIKTYINDGSGQFIEEQKLAVGSTAFDKISNSIFAADMDNDGDIDMITSILISADDITKFIWYENDGNGKFDENYHLISDNVDVSPIFPIQTNDFDKDGDLDIVIGIENSENIVQFENLGNGRFDGYKYITQNVFSHFSLPIGDMDNDGDMDICTSSFRDDKVVWFENLKTTPVTNIINPTLKLYPNPVRNILQIDSEFINSEIMISNVIGQNVKFKLEGNHINVANLNSGIYFITVKTLNGEISTKFIKE